jgi:hypothetical protein
MNLSNSKVVILAKELRIGSLNKNRRFISRSATLEHPKISSI